MSPCFKLVKFTDETPGIDIKVDRVEEKSDSTGNVSRVRPKC